METRVDLEAVTREAASNALQEARAVVLGVARYMRPAFVLPVILTDAVPTAAADEKGRLFFNPYFVAALTPDELYGVMAHELLHVVMRHPGERMARAAREAEDALQLDLGLEPSPGLKALALELANWAYDAEVNPLVRDMGFALPDGKEIGIYFEGEKVRTWRLDLVFPERFCSEKGKLGEEYLWELLDLAAGRGACEGLKRPQGGEGQNQDQGQGGLDALRRFLEKLSALDDASGSGSGGREEDDEKARARREAFRHLLEELDRKGIGFPLEELELLRNEIAHRVLEHSRSQGSVPEGLRRWAEERLTPKVDWRALLRRAVRKGYVDLKERVHPTYLRQSKRSHACRPVILPGGYALTPKVAVVVDTSGSVDDRMLAQALAETREILRGVGEATVYSVDAAVHHVQRAFRGHEIELYGGGGTDMGVGIERAVRDGHDLVVVLTDGYTDWPPHPPRRGVKVIAGVIGDGPAPERTWIQVVRIKD